MRIPVSVRIQGDDAWRNLGWPAQRRLATRALVIAGAEAQFGASDAACKRAVQPGIAPAPEWAKARGVAFHAQLESGQMDAIAALAAEARLDVRFAHNPGIRGTDVWTGQEAESSLVGDRRHALDLIGAPIVPAESRGEGVNVVIADYGLSERRLQWERNPWRESESAIAGGWARYERLPDGRKQYIWPGRDRTRGQSDHAHMVARNVLSIAPAATIWDVPVLPETILGPSHISIAEAIFYRIYSNIRDGRLIGSSDAGGDANLLPPGPWILVNAWSAHDRRLLAQEPFGRVVWYWQDRRHFFTEDMQRFSACYAEHRRCIDVVFSAGNAGVPGGDPMATAAGSGPGRSIHGVNAHANVLTVGAVRIDGVPIGLSAQGPGRLWQCHETISGSRNDDSFHNKPDICCPSHFRETDDGSVGNTGTSAACGVAAGLLAAVRGEEWRALRARGARESDLMSPAEMRGVIRRAASHARPRAAGWDPRLGWGIPDLRSALAELPYRLAAVAAAPNGGS
jgi:hypothetical protein